MMNNVRVEVINNHGEFSSILFLVEIPPEKGICHLIEHLIAKDLLPLVESHGFKFTAESGLGYTLYHVSGAETIPEELLLEIYQKIFNKELTEKEFLLEKNVVHEEIKKDLENPKSLIGELMYKLTTGSSVLGEIKEINGFTVSQIRDVYENNYVNGNVIIVTNREDYVKEVYLELIKGGRREIKMKFVYINKVKQIKNLVRSHFLMIIDMIGIPYFELTVLAQVFHSRILRILCRDEGRLYDFSCWTDLRTNFFCVDFSSDETTFSDNKMKLLALFDDFVDGQITEQEILAAKKKVLSEMKLSREDIRKKTYELAFFVKNDNLKLFYDYQEYFDGISLETLRRILDKIRTSTSSQLVLRKGN